MKKEIFVPNKKIISVTELKELGLSYYKINKLIDEGTLIRLNNKFMENLSFEGSESDWTYVSAYVPGGVVCLMSAAVLYQLTTYRPDVIDVAIERSKKVITLPEWPAIELHYYDPQRYHAGIDTVLVEECSIQVYDIEKTVADIVYFRNKVGIEETKEVLTNYLKRTDRQINRLLRYAEQLKCKKILNNYLEVLL